MAVREPLHLLTLRLEEVSGGIPDWLERRRLAMAPPPEIPGLRARFLRPEGRGIAVRYLFDDAESLQAVRTDPCGSDPPLAVLLESAEVTERVDELPAGAGADVFDRPVFLLAAPRSGSTLLYDLLARCEELWSLDREMDDLVAGIPKLHPANVGFRSHALGEDEAGARTAATLRACLLAEARSADGRRYLEREPAQRPDRLRFLDKTPENTLRIPFLRRLFPDARFVFLHRDPRQSVSSLVEAWQRPGFVSIPDLPGFPRRRWCFLLPEGWGRHRDASLSELAAFQWYEANRAVVHELEAIPRERWTTISYSDLVAAPAAQVRRLLSFLELAAGPRLEEALERPLPLSPTTVTPPSPIKWKSNADFDPEVLQRLQPLAGRIRTLDERDTPPVLRSSHRTDVRFACFVDELTPRSAPPDAVVAPSLQPQLGSAVPLSLLSKARDRERFLPEHPMLWIEDPASQVWSPLWLRRRQAWLCSQLRPGGPPPSALTRDLRDQMFASGALTTRAALERRRRHGERTVTAGRAALAREGFCVLRRFLDPVLTGALSRYYNAIIASGDWPLGDAQVEHRHGWHNERIARFVHAQLTEVLSSVAGRPLKPTYSFASAYRGGAALDAHTDREQCDYTLSLVIDQTAPPSASPWYLWFEAAQGRSRVDLGVSDAAFFRGCELPHWRDAASPDHEQINLLLHYVPAEWEGVLD